MKCPGQDMQFWDNDAIYEVKCPECGKMVEFYKDDTTRKCHHCNHRFVNPKMDFGCATYCQFAEQCLGTLPEEFVLQQNNLLKDKVAVAVKKYFKTDFKRIRLTAQIAAHAERIGKSIENANLALILCSSYLVLIVSPELDELDNTASISFSDDERITTAMDILKGVGANEKLIDQVLRILMNRPSVADHEKVAHNIVFDAYKIALLVSKNRENDVPHDELENAIASLSSDVSQEEARKALQG